MNAAQKLDGGNPTATFKLTLENEAIGMPLQLGFKKAEFNMVINLSITGVGPVDDIPALITEAPL